MIRGTKRPRVKAIEIIGPKAQKIDAKLNASIHNRFDIEVIDAATGVVKQRAQAQNVICNQLWTRLLTPAYYYNYIHYGTGSGTPATTDTRLFTFLGSKKIAPSNVVINNDPANGVFSMKGTIQISETEAVGSVLAEVGLGYDPGANTLVTHAMLKDMNGNPITIAKTNTDLINIYATIFLHYSSTGFGDGGIRIVPRNFNAKHNSYYTPGLNQFCGLLTALCGTRSVRDEFISYAFYSGGTGRYRQIDSISLGSDNFIWDIPNKRITIQMPRVSVSQNSRKLHNIAIRNTYTGANLLIRASSLALSSRTISGEAIGTGDGSTTDFSTLFPYDSNGTLYIDGTPLASGYSFSREPIDYNNLQKYFFFIDPDSTPQNLIPYNWDDDIYIPPGIAFYNPNYEVGIATITATNNPKLYGSNDLVSWTQVTNYASNSWTHIVPIEHQHFKFWKDGLEIGVSVSNGINTCIAPSNHVGKSVHFDVAPAAGAVITAGYTTSVIAKDANHVFDLTVTIQLGEYTE